MINLGIKTYFRSILIVSLIAIISAYYIEYVLGHQPCNLCLIERIPYALCLVLIIFNNTLIKNERFIILLLILTFIFSFITSFYHFGIEQGFFEESTVCGLKNGTDIISKEELLRQLNKLTISCKDVTFRVFGLSLTSINIVISLFFTITLLKIFIRYEKNK